MSRSQYIILVVAVVLVCAGLNAVIVKMKLGHVMTREEVESSFRQGREEFERKEKLLQEEMIKRRQSAPPPKKPIVFTSPADAAFKKAMDLSPTCNSDARSSRTACLKAWDEVLRRGDISEPQRLFAMWNQGVLLTMGADSLKGEKPDFVKGEELFKSIMKMFPGTCCEEKMHAALMYSSLSPNYPKRAELLAESYAFFMKISEQEIAESAKRINKAGYLLDAKYFVSMADAPPPRLPQSVNWLKHRLIEAISQLDKDIVEFLENSGNEAASARLLERIKDQVPKEKFERFKSANHFLNSAP